MSRRELGASSVTSSRRSGAMKWMSYPLLLALIGCIWGTTTSGLISSNDGSHLALTRSLALRHQPTLEEEAPLTLRVDLARRAGRLYSDRPPGTALLAIPAVWLGAKFDGALAVASQRERRVLQPPAGPDFSHTYRVRAPNGRHLLALQGSAIAATVHVGVLGLLTLVLLAWRLRSAAVRERNIAFCLLSLGLGSLLGPYAITMFGHVPAAFAVSLLYWSADRLRNAESEAAAALWRPGLALGVAGGLCVTTDYLLFVPVAALMLTRLRRETLAPVIVGSMVFGGAAAIYHTVAFGAPWAIGYDFHTNFEFARSRSTTFDGDIVEGVAALFGFDEGGVGRMSPLWYLGLIAFFWAPASADQRWRHWVERAGWLVWMCALARHQTPMGGAFHDHRYLIPLLPVLAYDLGRLMEEVKG
ncbi:MAG: hypothetical protein ACPHRO_11965, partial [Nannocystaceae bacterium]